MANEVRLNIIPFFYSLFKRFLRHFIEVDLFNFGHCRTSVNEFVKGFFETKKEQLLGAVYA